MNQPPFNATVTSWSDSVSPGAVPGRAVWFGAAVAAGVAIAGFWNVSLVDGFGRDVATQAMGGFEGRATQFAALGEAFGFFFAIVAGLAATFTACNCVAFAVVPGLACGGDAVTRRRDALVALGSMVVWVAIIGAVYGAFVGRLGPEGAAAFNTREIRGAQAFAVFSSLGIAMVLWGAIELGLLCGIVRRFSPATRAFFAQPTTKAALMGIMVGAFAIGRPYPVFREFLSYAAQANSPLYGAAVMAVQGVGQILVMAVLFVALVAFGYRRIERWMREKPHQPALVAGAALVTGGTFFIYYWGIVRLWPGLGRWGFALGLYE